MDLIAAQPKRSRTMPELVARMLQKKRPPTTAPLAAGLSQMASIRLMIDPRTIHIKLAFKDCAVEAAVHTLTDPSIDIGTWEFASLFAHMCGRWERSSLVPASTISWNLGNLGRTAAACNRAGEPRHPYWTQGDCHLAAMIWERDMLERAWHHEAGQGCEGALGQPEASSQQAARSQQARSKQQSEAASRQQQYFALARLLF